MAVDSRSSVTSRQALYRGSMPVAGRRPKTDERRRLCAVEHCDTVLSRYNLGESCRLHAPVRFPRTRGRPLEEVPGSEDEARAIGKDRACG